MNNSKRIVAMIHVPEQGPERTIAIDLASLVAVEPWCDRTCRIYVGDRVFRVRHLACEIYDSWTWFHGMLSTPYPQLLRKACERCEASGIEPDSDGPSSCTECGGDKFVNREKEEYDLDDDL